MWRTGTGHPSYHQGRTLDISRPDISLCVILPLASLLHLRQFYNISDLHRSHLRVYWQNWRLINVNASRSVKQFYFYNIWNANTKSQQNFTYSFNSTELACFISVRRTALIYLWFHVSARVTVTKMNHLF